MLYYRRTLLCFAITLLALFSQGPAQAEDVKLGSHTFTIPDGFTIQPIAAPPLVRSPICADFDDRGRLYVADSSGSNDPVKIQLENKPHRILRLEDVNGDGVFDKSIVFADGMMFPEGCTWHEGSVYVCAPPEIWKLTDTDDDGVADKREVWFDGKTLNGCANDLHGPYVGPDGWIYWCKGAFEEQTYTLASGKTFVTRASHIFRRRPEGGPIEPVMTGGMDNPVEVAFTAGGERIFTTTFLQHPGDGRRDGLIHAIYGGVYGKVHGVLEGHPRTGDVMPILSHMGAAAPCGLMRIESAQLGADYQDNLLACQFNTRRVSRHQLTIRGASFSSQDGELVVSDNLDFHPTDVLEDADGSLVVIDTGGWYKICCPTSQLWKPDVLGAIYRIRRTAAHGWDDPRGLEIEWDKLSLQQLVALLDEDRFAVRNRARRELGRRGPAAVAPLAEVLADGTSQQQRLHAVWSLSRIDGVQARSATRVALQDSDPTVRQAALHTISVHRDLASAEDLVALLGSDSAHNRRAAAEAIGRVGSPAHISSLLEAIAGCDDRSLQHSLTYAVMEISNPAEIRRVLESAEDPQLIRGGLIALDQIGDDALHKDDVLPILNSSSAVLRETAWWIVNHRSDWAEDVAPAFRQWLSDSQRAEQTAKDLTDQLARFASVANVQQVLADSLADGDTSLVVRHALLDAMIQSQLKQMPASWHAPLLEQLHSPDRASLEKSVEVARLLGTAAADAEFIERLGQLAHDSQVPAALRLRALAALPAARRPLDSLVLQFLVEHVDIDRPVVVRAITVDVMLSSPLNTESWIEVARALPSTGPMELKRLMEGFAKLKDPKIGELLVESLAGSPALTSLDARTLETQLSGYGPAVLASAAPLFEEIARENQEKNAKLETVLKLVPAADIRRGLEVFRNTKAACITCHQMAYLGGRVGPDLSRIGQIRSERDLLESILFPSASFVRSYESTSIVTTDGRILNGVIRDETSTHVLLQLDAQKQERIPIEEIDERAAGAVSIMPKGLDKQLTAQQLADLVKYLKSR